MSIKLKKSCRKFFVDLLPESFSTTSQSLISLSKAYLFYNSTKYRRGIWWYQNFLLFQTQLHLTFYGSSVYVCIVWCQWETELLSDNTNEMLLDQMYTFTSRDWVLSLSKKEAYRGVKYMYSFLFETHIK